MADSMHFLAQYAGEVDASVGAVWAIIAAFGSEALWMPTCISSSLEGFGIGAVRNIVLEDSSDVVIRERIEAADAINHMIRYSVTREDLPGVDSICEATMESLGEKRTRVKYVAHTNLPDKETREQFAPALEGIFRGNVESITSKLVK